MGDNNFLIVIGVIIAFPFVFYFLKVWLFATGTPGSTVHRVRRIADMDGHLSFDERLAEKLRELDEAKPVAKHAPPPDRPAPGTGAPATSFGRRGL